MNTPALRPAMIVVLGSTVLAAAIVLSLAVGVIHTTPGDVFRVLGDACAGRDDGSLAHTLVIDMRLPRALAGACVGAALDVSGCLLQSLLRDPLASPTLIGTAQASGFGRVLGVFLGWSYASSVALSFVTAMLGTAIVLMFARSRRGFPSQVVLLAGVNVGMLFAALIGLVQYASRDEGQLSRMVLMLLGGLWQVTWSPLALVAPFTIGALVLAVFAARRLDLFALGEENALRLGLSTRAWGSVLLAIACLLTSLAVSVAGIVAFVGLIVPHAARRIVGPAHAALVPACAFLGAAIVVATDDVARTVAAPNELPLGVLTSLVGVPCFLVLLRSQVRRGGAYGC